MNALKKLGSACLLLLLCCSALRLVAAPKTNIILIMADDMGFGGIAAYGHKVHKTPNIDSLATGGLKCFDFHSNGSVCSPTRAALMTGRYQQRSGIHGNVTAIKHRNTGLDPKETTFAEALKTKGYTTALFGKWHLGYGKDFNPIKQGFDQFNGFVGAGVDLALPMPPLPSSTSRTMLWLSENLVILAP